MGSRNITIKRSEKEADEVSGDRGTMRRFTNLLTLSTLAGLTFFGSFAATGYTLVGDPFNSADTISGGGGAGKVVDTINHKYADQLSESETGLVIAVSTSSQEILDALTADPKAYAEWWDALTHNPNIGGETKESMLQAIKTGLQSGEIREDTGIIFLRALASSSNLKMETVDGIMELGNKFKDELLGMSLAINDSLSVELLEHVASRYSDPEISELVRDTLTEKGYDLKTAEVLSSPDSGGFSFPDEPDVSNDQAMPNSISKGGR